MSASLPKQDWSVHYFRIYMGLLPVADTFFYLSSVVNPLLYNVSSKQFRSVFLQILRCRLTLEHANVERMRRAQIHSAASSTVRPFLSLKRHRSSRMKADLPRNDQSSDSPVPLPEMKAPLSEQNGLCESEI